MTVRAFDRWLGWACHGLGGAVFLLVCGVVSYAAGSLGNPGPWPYDVLSRRLLTEEVEPGGFIRIERVIEYHDDCDIRSERRVQSSLPTGQRYIAPDQTFEHPPWDRSGKTQQSALQIPEEFPCGPAYLVESVSVGCNLYQRLITRRKKRDVITPFFVTGCPPPT